MIIRVKQPRAANKVRYGVVLGHRLLLAVLVVLVMLVGMTCRAGQTKRSGAKPGCGWAQGIVCARAPHAANVAHGLAKRIKLNSAPTNATAGNTCCRCSHLILAAIKRCWLVHILALVVVVVVVVLVVMEAFHPLQQPVRAVLRSPLDLETP